MGGIGALVGHHHLTPIATMDQLVSQLKIWALVAALGGTVDMLSSLESHILDGHLGLVAQQLLMLLSAFAGAHLGYLLIMSLIKGDLS